MLELTTYLPKLKEFENSIPWMYQDSTGNVTVGVGHLLANAAAAQTLAFVRRANLAAKPPVAVGPATAAEIKTDFDNVNKQPANYKASYYKQFTKLDLPQTVIDSVLNNQVVAFKTSLCAYFTDFNSFSTEACAAVFDMAYNLGMTGLTSGFPAFCKAVKSQDWATAAKECHRLPPVSEARNSWTKSQLEKADKDAKAAEKKAGKAGTK